MNYSILSIHEILNRLEFNSDITNNIWFNKIFSLYNDDIWIYINDDMIKDMFNDKIIQSELKLKTIVSNYLGYGDRVFFTKDNIDYKIPKYSKLEIDEIIKDTRIDKFHVFLSYHGLLELLSYLEISPKKCIKNIINQINDIFNFYKSYKNLKYTISRN